MRYFRVSSAFMSILLIHLVNAEKKLIGNETVIVESAAVRDPQVIENVDTNEVNETIADEIHNVTIDQPLENNFIPIKENKIVVNGTNSSKKFIKTIEDDPNYVKGKYGGYYFIGTVKTKNYYFHGRYQEPPLNYYSNYNHTLEDNSTLGYYLGFSMNKMDHNEYFRHHKYTNFRIHHYYFKNSTMLPEQYISSDHLLSCAKNTSIFCPENTESICLQNSTVWCATKISHTKECEIPLNATCVRTRLPCIKSYHSNCNRLVEIVDMPCIAIIKILDSMEDKNGLTIIRVAGTFVLAPVSPIEERTFCVTIVAEPSIKKN